MSALRLCQCPPQPVSVRGLSAGRRGGLHSSVWLSLRRWGGRAFRPSVLPEDGRPSGRLRSFVKSDHYPECKQKAGLVLGAGHGVCVWGGAVPCLHSAAEVSSLGLCYLRCVTPLRGRNLTPVQWQSHFLRATAFLAESRRATRWRSPATLGTIQAVVGRPASCTAFQLPCPRVPAPVKVLEVRRSIYERRLDKIGAPCSGSCPFAWFCWCGA